MLNATDPNLDTGRFPPSLWADTAAPAPSTGPLEPGEYFADLVVIGGGFTGLSTALHASERGARVILLEASEIGWGASGRNNGQVIPAMTRADPDVIVREYGQEKGEALVNIIGGSGDKVFELVRKHRIACAAVQSGWIQPAHRLSRMDLARSRVQQWTRRGFAAELLGRDQTRSLIGSDLWFGGWQNRTGGHINPLAFVRGLASAAQSVGSVIHTRSAVVGISRRPSGWRVSTQTAHVNAPKVLVATHAYSGALGLTSPWPKLASTMIPMRSYQLATQPLPAELRATILPQNHAMSDTHGDLHLGRFDETGRLITGGALIVPFGYEQRLRKRLQDRLKRMFPQLRDFPLEFDYVWHGNFAVTPDGIPRFVKLGDGLYTWLGCNGRGVALSTALGPVLVDAIFADDLSTSVLPFERMRCLSAHALVKRTAIAAMLLYRWRDSRE
jgi:glycine/D-amino acid oxidase-like deaminating enzyme